MAALLSLTLLGFAAVASVDAGAAPSPPRVTQFEHDMIAQLGAEVSHAAGYAACSTRGCAHLGGIAPLPNIDCPSCAGTSSSFYFDGCIQGRCDLHSVSVASTPRSHHLTPLRCSMTPSSTPPSATRRRWRRRSSASSGATALRSRQPSARAPRRRRPCAASCARRPRSTTSATSRRCARTGPRTSSAPA